MTHGTGWLMAEKLNQAGVATPATMILESFPELLSDAETA
jgi:hypothetical protein